MNSYKLTDIIDTKQLQNLCESFTQFTGMGTAINDLDGTVYVASGWQSICEHFHRKNELTKNLCIESDTVLAAEIKKGYKYNVYKCKNGLVDIAVPIYVGDIHIGNFFTGQFFFESPDYDFFEKQARVFNFNQNNYMEALKKVPVFSEEHIQKAISFIVNLTETIGSIGLARLKNIQYNKELEKQKEILKKQNEELVDSEEKLRTIFDILNVGLSITDDRGYIIDCNKASEKILGISREEHLTKSFNSKEWKIIRSDTSIMPSDEYANVRALKEKKPILNIEMGIIKDNNTSWLLVNAVPLPIKGYGVVIAYIDVTEQKKLEESIRLHSKIASNMSEGLSMVRAKDGIIVFTNERFEKMFGYEKDEMIGKHVSIVNDPNDRDPAETATEIIKSMEINGAWSGEIKNIKKDGTLFVCYASVSGFEHYEHGKILVTTQFDITERKAMEEALKSNELLLNKTEQLTKVGGWEYYVFTDKLVWSRETYRIHEVSYDFIPNKESALLFYYGDDQGVINNLFINAIKYGDSFDKEMRLKTSKGNLIWVRVIGEAFELSGRIKKVSGTIQDITEFKNTEQALKESELKMQKLNATKDKFFSILAHDLKSPINSFSSLINILIEFKEKISVDELQRYLIILKKSSQGLSSFLENLLTWARAQSGDITFNPVHKNLAELVNTNIELMSSNAESKKIKIINKLNKDLFVSFDVEMINTVIRNLLNNAIKYTNENGNIVISAKSKKESIEFSIKDNGVGMSNSTYENLFRIDVKQRNSLGTKGETGTGLGLILCKEFIEKHGGKIWFQTELNKGSEFKFSLPRARTSRNQKGNS